MNEYFFLFHSASLGSIHACLQKLHAEKYVDLKKSMSKRGQRSSHYSITKAGKSYFEELMLDEFPKNPLRAAQLVKIKILLLPKLELSVKKEVVSLIKDYYENRLLDLQNYKNDNVNTDYIKYCINSVSNEINWLKIQAIT